MAHPLKEVCSGGHPYLPETTGWRKSGKGRPHKTRYCKICHTRQASEWRRQRRRELIEAKKNPPPPTQAPWMDDYLYGKAVHERRRAQGIRHY